MNRTARTDRKLLTRLLTTAERLGADELAVLELLAHRLRQGQRRYGELRLRTDRRDFGREAIEEAADLAVYAAAGCCEKSGESGERGGRR